MKEKILFIINPISGGKSKASIPKSIHQYIDKLKYEVEIAFTDYPGQGTELTIQGLEKGIKTFVAVGGDGTVNEVAKALLYKDAVLGIIPAGSGNGLARHLNISVNTNEAILTLNKRKIKIIDSGSMNDQPFFCTSGMGFDAHIGMMFAEKSKRGFKTYVTTTLNEFFSYKPSLYSIETSNGIINNKAFLITLANASQYGNNAYISPNANIEDGLLDICVMSPFPKYGLLELGTRLFTKSIHRSSYLQIIKEKEFTIIRENAAPVHLDGEPMQMGKDLRIKVNPKSLNVLVN